MYAEPKVQALSAIVSAAIVLGLALVLVFGLRTGAALERAESLVSVALELTREPPPEPPPPPPRPARASAPKGDPAPRNLHNKATQVAAPPVPFQLIPPPPIMTAPKANLGDAASSGASNLPGPGQGAGGIGDGFGGGGDGGDGTGRSRAHGGEPPVQGPRQIRGKLSYSDIPAGTLPEGHGAVEVEVLFAVNPDGGVSDCQIERSSGYPRLDAHVCRLIEQRFVFRPARDRFGRPVRARVAEAHSWYGRPE